jgi:TRAP-type C4-dicarboxylate transport system permease small subunit
MEDKTAKLIVKIIAILGFISAALLIVMGVLLFLQLQSPGCVTTGGSTKCISQDLASKINTEYIVGGILFIIGALFVVFVNIKLWNYKNWARILTMAGCFLSVVSSFGETWIFIVLSVIFNGVIIYFLGIEPSIVNLFQKKTETKKVKPKKTKKK